MIAYCTACGKESCQHGGWTSRSDEALMRLALEALELAEFGGAPAGGQRTCPVCYRGTPRHGHERGCTVPKAIDALNERLLT